MQALNLSFYRQDTIEVAIRLLGKTLIHKDAKTKQTLSGIIVETEAYLGAEDPACHSFGHRRTSRTEVMFEAGGLSYVYFIYGMFYCLNVVTAPKNVPEAVLIRAVEPLEGLEMMQQRRPRAKKRTDLTNGPGKLCQAFGIDQSHNYQSFISSSLSICEGHQELLEENIASSPRIGLSPFRDSSYWPLRFFIKDNPFVSRPLF